MKYFSIKSLTFFLLIYFLANIVFGFYWGFLGFFSGGDFRQYEINNYILYYAIFAFEILLMFFLLILARFLFLVTGKINIDKESGSRVISYILFFVQVLYLIYSVSTGDGMLKEVQEFSGSDNPLRFLFAFFYPDYFFLSVFMVEKRISKANIAIYIISNIIRGWILGALMSLIFIFFFKKQFRVKIKFVFILFFVFIFLAPSLYFVKNISRGSEVPSEHAYYSYYSKDLYFDIVVRNLSRFQHISEIYVIYENFDVLESGYKNKEFVPFYVDNQFRNLYARAFDYESNDTVGKFVVNRLMENRFGNTHVGIITWLGLSPILYLIYALTSIVMLSFLLKTLASNGAVAFSCLIFVVFMHFMHGWFSSYFIFLWSLFMVLLIKLFSRVLYKSKFIMRVENT